MLNSYAYPLSAQVSRALGIPCRVVTNFSSAHDGNGNLLIEKMYDEDGERLEDPDSVWSVYIQYSRDQLLSSQNALIALLDAGVKKSQTNTPSS